MKKYFLIFSTTLLLIIILLFLLIQPFPTKKEISELTNQQASELLKGKTMKQIHNKWDDPDGFLSGMFGDIYIYENKMIVIYYNSYNQKVIDVIISDKQQ